MAVKRFGVSLEEDMLDKLDGIVDKEKFPNRSQAIKHLVNSHEVEGKWNSNDIVAGAIVLIYDHHKTDLPSRITQLQHEYHCLILATQHIHLDEHNCIETISVKGNAERIRKIADKLKAIKGIKHGNVVITAPN